MIGDARMIRPSGWCGLAAREIAHKLTRHTHTKLMRLNHGVYIGREVVQRSLVRGVRHLLTTSGFFDDGAIRIRGTVSFQVDPGSV
jgi:hypothetical protein